MALASPTRDATTAAHLYDVVIVGGGVAGAVAAARLGAHARVALVDRHAVYPPDFRADKVSGSQIDMMRRLGLEVILTDLGARSHSVARVHDGRVVGLGTREEFNMPYEALVNGVRTRIPDQVRRIVGRVARIEADAAPARVTLASGEILHARLVVLATGLGDALRRDVGIERRMLRAAHSVTIGFDIDRANAAPLPAESLCLYGKRPKDGIDYISIFPFPNGLRANLFVYLAPRDPWVSAFLADPKTMLLKAFPGLDRQLGDFTIGGRVHMRPMDLYETRGYVRPGVVLIGDAFRSGCPAVGSGLTRALTDVETLERLLPGWLATPGMGADKIAAFYDDPAKRACDAQAAHNAEYRRASTIGTGLRWTLHRQRVEAQARVRDLLAHMRRRAAAAAA